MKRIYISGRISGLPYDQVQEKFAAAARSIVEEGNTPLDPLSNGLNLGEPWEKHMVADIAMLLQADQVWMLPDWRESTGARIEHYIAKEKGIPIDYLTAVEVSKIEKK